MRWFVLDDRARKFVEIGRNGKLDDAGAQAGAAAGMIVGRALADSTFGDPKIP